MNKYAEIRLSKKKVEVVRDTLRSMGYSVLEDGKSLYVDLTNVLEEDTLMNYYVVEESSGSGLLLDFDSALVKNKVKQAQVLIHYPNALQDNVLVYSYTKTITFSVAGVGGLKMLTQNIVVKHNKRGVIKLKKKRRSIKIKLEQGLLVESEALRLAELVDVRLFKWYYRLQALLENRVVEVRID